MTFDINFNDNFQRGYLPQSIIWPENEDDIPWFMSKLYDQMVSSINSRDFGYFQMAISDKATPIPNMTNFGSYMICVGGSSQVLNEYTGVINWLPSYVWVSTKTQDTQAPAAPNLLSSQVGIGDTWSGATLTLSDIAVNGVRVYALNHNKAGKTASFNVRIIGTQ